jgi:hypothetical protein
MAGKATLTDDTMRGVNRALVVATKRTARFEV